MPLFEECFICIFISTQNSSLKTNISVQHFAEIRNICVLKRIFKFQTKRWFQIWLPWQPSQYHICLCALNSLSYHEIWNEIWKCEHLSSYCLKTDGFELDKANLSHFEYCMWWLNMSCTLVILSNLPFYVICPVYCVVYNWFSQQLR